MFVFKIVLHKLRQGLRGFFGFAGLMTLFVIAPQTVVAQDTKSEIVSDSIDRIRLASQLPMMTQRVAAASCALASDVAVVESRDALREGAEMFETIVLALRDGNEALHVLAPETRKRTIVDIENVWSEWEATHQAIARLLGNEQDTEAAHVIDDHNLALLDLTNRLAADITSQYADPFVLTLNDAFAFGLMARQRTLTQQMAKDACEIWTAYNSKEAKDDLQAIASVFERSLNALMNGMPEAGIVPAPTDEIRMDLMYLIDRWGGIRPNLDTLVAGQEISAEAKEEIVRDFELELEYIDKLVMHYRDYTERAH